MGLRFRSQKAKALQTGLLQRNGLRLMQKLTGQTTTQAVACAYHFPWNLALCIVQTYNCMEGINKWNASCPCIDTNSCSLHRPQMHTPRTCGVGKVGTDIQR